MVNKEFVLSEEEAKKGGNLIMVNWKHGNILEVARILHEKYNVGNITYETSPSSVIFLSDGFFFAYFEYGGK